VRGYWVDPSTGLMWAGRDNGKDVSWKGALRYCRNLRLAGHSDWRLATLTELGEIYDKNANAPGLAGMHDDVHTNWRVRAICSLPVMSGALSAHMMIVVILAVMRTISTSTKGNAGTTRSVGRIAS
jgi:hypothetical protein